MADFGMEVRDHVQPGRERTVGA